MLPRRRDFLFLFFATSLALTIVLAFFRPSAVHADRPQFTVAWSIYVGWDPYQYMVRSGILKRWEDKYNVGIRVQRFDYAPSLDAFVSRNVDACTMTNMEALDMPAASGVDSTAIIVGDYSNGNDALLVRNNLNFSSLNGKRVLLVEKTVSEYLLERGLSMNKVGSGERGLKLVNTADSDIVTAFLSDPGSQAVVTWKPLVSQIRRQPGVSTLFDSSKIPGEILDLLVVRTDVLARPDGVKFAKAITGAWYDVMKQLASGGAQADTAMRGIASVAGDSIDSFKEQLATTKLYEKPSEAVSFTDSGDLKNKMELVRQFCFHHQLLGQHASSADDVAISYPDGVVQGHKDRVRLHFSDNYMKLAADNKL